MRLGTSGMRLTRACITVAVYSVAGLAATIAAAAACHELSPWKSVTGPHDMCGVIARGEDVWRVDRDDSLGSTQLFGVLAHSLPLAVQGIEDSWATYESQGVAVFTGDDPVPHWSLLRGRRDNARQKQGMPGILLERACGWPFRAFSESHQRSRSDAFDRGELRLVGRSYPAFPIWSGLLLDTAAWAALTWGVVACAKLGSAQHRRRRGRCARCGYQLAGLDTGSCCPECGAPQSKSDGRIG